MRKGATAGEAGRRYREFGEMLIRDQERLPNHTIVKFENVLQDAFRAAEHLFEFVNVTPRSLPKLRIKDKGHLHKDGSYSTHFGGPPQKYWFTPTEIDRFLNQDVDKQQSSYLDQEDREAFEREAKPVLEHFGYLEGPFQ
jgi:hypothetical protein